MKWPSPPVFCFLLACSLVRADSWALKPEIKDTEYVFGDTRIVLHYDSTGNDQYPEHTTRIHRKDKLLGEYDGIGFEKLFASPDNTYFLGLSNSGLVDPAYVVFDRDGKLVKMQPHDPRTVSYTHLRAHET